MKKKTLILALMMALMLVVTACSEDKGRGRGTDAPVSDVTQEKDSDVADEKDEEVTDEKDEEKTEDTQEEKEPQKDTNAEVNVPANLSDDIYSFQVSIDGTVYQFPMWAKDFKALGWTYSGDGTKTLSSNEYTTAETWEKGDAKVYTSLINLTMNSVTFEEAAVGGITLEEFYLKDCNMEIVLPKGIQYKVSSRDDIRLQ